MPKEMNYLLSRRKALTLILAGIVTTGAYIAFNTFITKREEVVKRGINIEEVIKGMVVPWSITFLNEDEVLITERGGRVSIADLSSGKLSVMRELEVAAVGEAGLLGSATDRSRVYLYYTYREGNSLFNRISSFDVNLQDEVVLLDRIPGASIHDGGRLKIGPDEKLYATTGDAAEPNIAQRLDSLGGKVLRIEKDGRLPRDNPFDGSPIYSYGHRNPQGIAWHLKSSALYATEHGPSGEFGKFANDEVNLIVPGGNYGWPIIVGRGGDERYIDPIYYSGDETWAPAGCTFYSGKLNDEWSNNFFFATLRGKHLHRVVFDDEGKTVVSAEKLFPDEFGRLRDVVEGPDGTLYLLTNNRDGRGSPREGDDKLIRLVPKK